MAYRPGEDIAAILEQIKNPLVYYALSLLVTESLLYLSVTHINDDWLRFYLVFLMAFLFLVVIGIVAYVTIRVPEHLYELVADRIRPVVASQVEIETKEIRDETYFALIAIGRHYHLALNFDKAIEAYKRALKIMENKAAAYTGLAITYAQRGDLGEAITAANRAVQITEARDTEALLARARVHSARKELDPAMRDINAVRVLDPENKELFFAEGVYFMFGRKEYDQAELAFSRAIEKDENHFIAYYNRACCRQYLGKWEEALADLRQAVTLDSRNVNFAKQDPDMERLRNHPEYRKRVQAILGAAPS